MDLSALEKDIKALEISLDSIEWWISASTFLVVIGLVVEYWFPLSDLVKALRSRPPFPWAKLTETVGGVFVTIGVAGELWFQSNASLKQTFLRTRSHQVEALLNIEAGKARKEALDANVLAKRYEADIAGSDARAKHAEAQVALANAASRDAIARVASADARSAEASAKAESFRLAIAKAEQRTAESVEKTAALQAVVMPLDLDEKQQSEITAVCKKYSGRFVIVSSSNMDIEGRILAGLITASLKQAGIAVAQFPNRKTLGLFRTGVAIVGVANDDFVETLRKSLADIGRLDVNVERPSPYSKPPRYPIVFVGVYPFKKGQE